MNSTSNGSMENSWKGGNSTMQPENYTEAEIESYLQYLEYENAKLMIPTLVYIGTLISTGLFGNTLVILVYYFRFKPSTTRIFIISLAVFDLMNNTMAQPGEIFDILYAYRFTNNHLCKLKRFFNYFTTFSSVFSLTVVAVDRQRKICHAVKKQISIKIAKICVIVVASLSLGISMPSLMLNGVKNIPTGKEGILGTECKYADNFQNAFFPKLFLGFQFLIFLSSLTLLSVLYILIGRTVFKHSKFNLRGKRLSVLKPAVIVAYSNNSSTGPSSGNTTSTNPDSHSDKEQNEATDHKDSNIKVEKNTEGELVETKADVTEEPTKLSTADQNTEVVSTPSTPRQKDKKDKVTLLPSNTPSPGFDKLLMRAQHQEKKEKVKKMKTRTTLMLFLITLVFIISYLPYLSISIVKMFNKNFVNSLSIPTFMVYNVFLRSHYINAAVNPLVYSFCNMKFRSEAKSILCFWKKNKNKMYT
ncbi:hypothetical protein LOTGIDRAFT_235583 [Lottia gigantea]|uniref:G-protein coupled receptors family 1 profile domain-containing protein n=1 Tax=Lottia gigantea TaxID=225164 RepID=V4BAJ7_LOTGI|nr:hypothetical protein LOTGIDRAFT_235583 [Lottia gigantea]ESO85989.1 hypothetical protein LOTGIDRAFT_235583 [Lottia gigantea]